MRRLVPILAVALMLTGCAVADAGDPAPIKQPDVIEVAEIPEVVDIGDAEIEELKKSCVTIYADFGDSRSQGTAVAVGADKYLTAYHAAQEHFTNIRTIDGVNLTLDTFDSALDIATLKSSAETVFVKTGDVRDSRVGDEVIIIGSPNDKDDTVTHATIKKIVGVIIVNGALDPGSSGSGVFNMQGELIGIVVGADEDENKTEIVSINAINKTL
jgi:S1-C subfamily serine protease